METYIALLLLIVPGFMAECIYEMLNHGRRQESEFDKTVSSLIFSIFIIFLNYCVIINNQHIFNVNLINVENLKVSFGNVSFLIKYIKLTVFMSIFVAYFWDLIHPRITIPIINSIRKTESKNCINLHNVWDVAFDDGKKHALRIEKDNQVIAEGLLKYVGSSYNNEKEMYLERQVLFEKHKDCFDDIKGIYVNYDKNIKIIEFKLDKLDSLRKKKS